MRGRLVAGNWKMHGSRAANPALLDAVLSGLSRLPGVECAVCVPFPYLSETSARLAGSTLGLGAQTVSEFASGAYTGEVSAVMAARDELERRLEVQGDIEGTLARLEKEIAATERAAKQEAQALRTAREKAAKELSKVAAKGIAQLGFKKADFSVRVVSLAEMGPTGDCGCEFLFSPNVGEAPLPLNRVASSGELARVMLALKTVLADLDGVPLLVFDEVDANVGGEIGRVVGEKMAAIAQSHQVLCVTHLPQVAAQATCHLVVTKDQSKDRAVVTIEPIQASRKARVSELARMLGDSKAKSALAHAEELLSKI